MMTRNRYVLVTVDVEAQPARAKEEHVKRLVWGEYPNGQAGIRELCTIANDAGSKLVNFVDACGVYLHGESFIEAVQWMIQAGHDVQLHTHSEFLPDPFWIEHGFATRPRLLNQYDESKAYFTLQYFSEYLSQITKQKIRAFRAGSFRWNIGTLKAQGDLCIPLSFNNTMTGWLAGTSPYAESARHPFKWSNGVVEVPITERRFFYPSGQFHWKRLAFPRFKEHRNPPWKTLWPFTLGSRINTLVVLLHSWSLLYWDENGYAVYKDDKRLEDFRKLIRRLAKDYDIITTADFLDLYKQGKIKPTHTVDISLAEKLR